MCTFFHRIEPIEFDSIQVLVIEYLEKNLLCIRYAFFMYNRYSMKRPVNVNGLDISKFAHAHDNL